MEVFNMRRLRREQNLSQAALAEILSVPQSSISSMEKGKTKVSDAYITILEDKFNIKRADYMEDEKKVFIYNKNVGSNNGYMETDPELVKQISELNRFVMDLGDKADTRRDEYDRKIEEVRAERDKFQRMVFNLKLLLATNGIAIPSDDELAK